MSERTDDRLAEAWCAEHWETLFGELGSYDFAREAFKAGWNAHRDSQRSYHRALLEELGEDPL